MVWFNHLRMDSGDESLRSSLIWTFRRPNSPRRQASRSRVSLVFTKAIHHADTDRFTREGQPTPVQPDFSNLQQVWATISPSSVEMSAYAATMTTKAPECPPFTVGGWSISPDAPLPTLGAIKIASGMPSDIPKGSITVSGVSSVTTTDSIPVDGSSSAPLAATTEAPHSHPGADPTSAEDSAASTTGAAVRQQSIPFNLNVVVFDVTSLLIGLTAAGAVFVLLL